MIGEEKEEIVTTEAPKNAEEVFGKMFPPGTHPLETDVILRQDGTAQAIIYLYRPTQQIVLNFEKATPREIEDAITKRIQQILSTGE